MRTRYDSEADALYMRLADGPIVDSQEVSPRIVLDFDGDRRVVAIEILDVSEHVAKGADFSHFTAA